MKHSSAGSQATAISTATQDYVGRGQLRGTTAAKRASGTTPITL